MRKRGRVRKNRPFRRPQCSHFQTGLPRLESNTGRYASCDGEIRRDSKNPRDCPPPIVPHRLSRTLLSGASVSPDVGTGFPRRYLSEASGTIPRKTVPDAACDDTRFPASETDIRRNRRIEASGTVPPSNVPDAACHGLCFPGLWNGFSAGLPERSVRDNSAHGRQRSTPRLLQARLLVVSRLLIDGAMRLEQEPGLPQGVGVQQRTQPVPLWPKSKSAGCRSSARISADSTSRGPGRLKYWLPSVR